MAVIGLTLRVLLITVLVWSSAAKLRPSGFRAVVDMLRQLGLGRGRVLVGAALVGTEITTAALLAVPATARAATVLALVLFAGLTGGVAVVLRRGLDVRCACFGAQTARLGPVHLLRNGVLLACAAGAVLTTSSASAGSLEPGAHMIVIAVMIGLLAVVTGLNLFLLLGVIRRLREMSGAQGPQGSDLPAAGSVIGEFAEYTVDGVPVGDEQLASGRSLVVFVSPSCAPCQEAVTRLAERRHQLPTRTYVFVQAEPDEPRLAPMLVTLDGVATVVVLSATGTAQAAFGISGFPTAVVVQDGRVASASFDVTEALPLMREKTLAR